MILHASQHFLLQGLVDYAGLFPPAQLDLPEVVSRYREALKGPGASLLGRLVCPAGRLEDLLGLLSAEDAWNVSALASEPAQLEWIEAFHRQAPRSVRVDSLEVVFGDAEQAARWSEGWNYHLYLEVAPSQFDQAASWCSSQGPRCALKLRTGGLRPEAFPSTDEVAHFLECLSRHRVAAKFTAGLHHVVAGEYPLCYTPDSPRHRMFGFLPLFAAGAFQWWQRLCPRELRELLELDRLELTADADGLHWRGHRLSLEELQEARLWLRSFGSCSFEEPLEELQQHRWIQ